MRSLARANSVSFHETSRLRSESVLTDVRVNATTAMATKEARMQRLSGNFNLLHYGHDRVCGSRPRVYPIKAFPIKRRDLGSSSRKSEWCFGTGCGDQKMAGDYQRSGTKACA